MRAALVLATFISTALGQGIQWTKCPLNGHYYALTGYLTWTQAEAFAVAHGAHLATIRSAGENWWVWSNLGSNPHMWIGYSDAVVEGTWVWSSGEANSYTHWDANEPSGQYADFDYAAFGSGLGSSSWGDQSSTDILPGVMELSAPASWTTFGSGCAGAASTPPLLNGVVGEAPVIGSVARMQVTGLPLTITLPVFVLGLSNTQDPGPPAYALPLDLGFLGWPGCSQLVSDDLSSFAITTTGQANYTISVPQNLALMSFTLHAQVLALLAGGGVAFSNGLTAVVGV